MKAPSWINTLYSRFPLVILEQEDDLEWSKKAQQQSSTCTLWITPASDSRHPHFRSWASSSPSSLRAQLLFLLRNPPVRVTFKSWLNEDSAPGSNLPALHLTDENRLLGNEDIRSWLDEKYPLKGKGKELQGLPDQESYDRALAIAQLVLGNILPAYLISLPQPPPRLHLLFPIPPPLSAGLSTPLPASLTGDSRDIDKEEVLRKGVEALGVLPDLIGINQSDWALNASRPTPLDALLVSHIYPIFSLSEESDLRKEISRQDGIRDYVERIMEYAGANLI